MMMMSQLCSWTSKIQNASYYISITVLMCSVYCVAFSGIFCELDKNEDKTCIIQSPLIPDTFNWTCLYVSYQLSSVDVKMTLDLLEDDESIKSYTLLANESLIQIPNPNLESSSRLQLAASRYLVSTEDYEYALVTCVKFLPCTTDTGRFLYLQVAQLSQRDRAAGWVSNGQKWKTGTERQYLRTM